VAVQSSECGAVSGRGFAAAEAYSPRPLTAGERWTAEALATLRRGGYGPRSWVQFLRSALERSAENRRARPELVRQARGWGLAGAVAWVGAWAFLRPRLRLFRALACLALGGVQLPCQSLRQRLPVASQCLWDELEARRDVRPVVLAHLRHLVEDTAYALQRACDDAQRAHVFLRLVEIEVDGETLEYHFARDAVRLALGLCLGELGRRLPVEFRHPRRACG